MCLRCEQLYKNKKLVTTNFSNFGEHFTLFFFVVVQTRPKVLKIIYETIEVQVRFTFSMVSVVSSNLEDSIPE